MKSSYAHMTASSSGYGNAEVTGWHSGGLLRIWVSGHESGISVYELHLARVDVR